MTHPTFRDSALSHGLVPLNIECFLSLPQWWGLLDGHHVFRNARGRLGCLVNGAVADSLGLNAVFCCWTRVISAFHSARWGRKSLNNLIIKQVRTMFPIECSLLPDRVPPLAKPVLLFLRIPSATLGSWNKR